MQKLPGKRALALVLGLTVATAGAAVAQDTTETGRAAIDTTAPAGGALDTAGVDTSAARDTTDTSGVQNPPGYRGMERDTTMFPPDTGGTQPSAGQVEDRTTGTYENEEWRDTTGAEQNPAGYRGMERPAGGDTVAADTSAADTSAADTSAADTSGAAAGVGADTSAADTSAADTSAADTSAADTSAAAAGVGADTSATGAAGDTSAQNPPGYRGMERDTTMFPADTVDESSSAGQVEDRATGTYDDRAWQDTAGAEQATDSDTASTDASSGASGSVDTSATGHTGHESESEESN